MEAILHHFSNVLSLEGLIETWLPTVLGLALVSSLEELVLRAYGLHAAGLVNAAANGILLAWLVMRTGSLWMACAYHASWNITGALILGMRLSGLDHAGGLLNWRLYPSELLPKLFR